MGPESITDQIQKRGRDRGWELHITYEDIIINMGHIYIYIYIYISKSKFEIHMSQCQILLKNKKLEAPGH